MSVLGRKGSPFGSFHKSALYLELLRFEVWSSACDDFRKRWLWAEGNGLWPDVKIVGSVLVCDGCVFQILGRSDTTGKSCWRLHGRRFGNVKVGKKYFWWESWERCFGDLNSQDCRPMRVEKCWKRRPSAAKRWRHGLEKRARVGGWIHG
jgi:hypothetical protein